MIRRVNLLSVTALAVVGGFACIDATTQSCAAPPTNAVAVSGDQSTHSGSARTAQAYARMQLPRHGWGSSQMHCLISLWNQESGWNSYAVNPSSGAAGIAQSLGHGHVTLGDYRAQVRWGLSYIHSRYGDPCGAWAHETSRGWY